MDWNSLVWLIRISVRQIKHDRWNYFTCGYLLRSKMASKMATNSMDSQNGSPSANPWPIWVTFGSFLCVCFSGLGFNGNALGNMCHGDKLFRCHFPMEISMKIIFRKHLEQFWAYLINLVLEVDQGTVMFQFHIKAKITVLLWFYFFTTDKGRKVSIIDFTFFT